MNHFSPRRILVPVDSCEPSLSALQAASALGKRFASRLKVIYVEGFFPLSPAGRWDNLSHAVHFHSSRLRVRTIRGRPATILGRLAQPRHADLVVMGTHGFSGMERAQFGSITEAVMCRAGVPVLAVHERERPFQVAKVLIPCNMQPHAMHALRYGLDVARALGAEVWVLYVGLPEEAHPEGLRHRLERQLGFATGGGRRLIVGFGNPHEVIVAQAKQGGFDLIALSTHRRATLGSHILGSTAERVLRHSPIPLLCVPSGAAKSPQKQPLWRQVVSDKIF